MSLKILILGINGFIGSNLTEAILKQKPDWEIYGMDLTTNKLGDAIEHERCHFTKGDITSDKGKAWVEHHVKEECDVVLPLVAVATPAIYITNPMRVFELDFEANLPIVRHCLKYQKRIIFPSTSEVYGMSSDKEFDEETSMLTQGPINKERWIYSCCKQLMDRVIYAYGNHGDHNKLQFTLFRPFNWTGPKLDDVHNLKEGSSRVVSQFISNIIYGKNLQLVGGGEQKRCFTYISDAIDALIKIIDNKDGCADGRIFNIGNPNNNASIREIAEKLIKIAKDYPKYRDIEDRIKIVTTEAAKYYGAGYQDTQLRVPKIQNAASYLGWKPTTDLDQMLKLTADYYLK